MKKLVTLLLVCLLGLNLYSAAANEWPEKYPVIPTQATEETYSYDDMSQRYDIELLVVGYINVDVEPDPVEKNIEDKFNIDITYNAMSGGDLESVLMTRFASGDAPDMVKFGNKNLALQLFNEGMLMNPEPLLQYMPTVKQYITKNFKAYVTDRETSEMFALTQLGGPNIWGYYYRSDWLKKFDMEPPTTREEIIEYAKKCTFDDPDGNGIDDTWFMGAAGNGQGFGMLESFRSMFGHPSYNVVDGKINHPMLDGTTKAYLEFLHELYTLGVLSPDFYTIDWESFKSYTMADKIGMVNYPGDQLLTEYLSAKGGLAGVDDVQANIVTWMPLPAAPSISKDIEGKYPPAGSPDGIWIFNVDLLENEGKMKRLAHLVDWMSYPNEGFFQTQHSGDPSLYVDYTDIWPWNTSLEWNIGYNPETGKYVWDWSALEADPLGTPVSQSHNNMGLHDWQALNLQYTYKEYTHEVYGAQQNYNNDTVSALPRWENNDLLLSLDADTATAVQNFATENQILFVMGQKSFDEWDTYLSDWLSRGGEALLQEAAEQLGAER
jgi:putative aldouronate transport system substrate-binding protein